MELIYVSNDHYGRLVAHLDTRRQMIKRHERELVKSSRKQHRLTEKIEIQRRHKAELVGINGLIDALHELGV